MWVFLLNRGENMYLSMQKLETSNSTVKAWSKPLGKTQMVLLYPEPPCLCTQFLNARMPCTFYLAQWWLALQKKKVSIARHRTWSSIKIVPAGTDTRVLSCLFLLWGPLPAAESELLQLHFLCVYQHLICITALQDKIQQQKKSAI